MSTGQFERSSLRTQVPKVPELTIQLSRQPPTSSACAATTAWPLRDARFSSCRSGGVIRGRYPSTKSLRNTAGERREKIDSAVLAAWTLKGEFDLRASELFGVDPALLALLDLIGPSPEGDILQAKQSAIASYSPFGFEAAALDVFSLMARGRPLQQTKRGVLRRASLFFDHPYVAVALAGNEIDFRIAGGGHPDLFCLPLFAAWVSEPSEPSLH